ncbi:MAG: 2-succinyl-5-enolpyruvyl-6-hydroxy-3-cyclohexene-1-carboxylic-acid synthase [Bacteroidota bacterium]
MISDKLSVQQIVAYLKVYGISQVVISPGSRNAPLTYSFDQDEFFKTYSIVDERAAAFFALGIAQQSQKSVALTCTSGTALLNYAPAIAEAFYQRIPLLVLSADRPDEMLNQGFGQTIDQKQVFDNFIHSSVHLKGEGDNEAFIAEALSHLYGKKPGPVQINVPLREPLYEFVPNSLFKIEDLRWKMEEAHQDFELPLDFSSEVKNAKRILVLTGQLSPDSKLNKELAQFAQRENVLVMTETGSNLFSEDFLPCTDRMVFNFDEADCLNFQPDLVITIGTNIVSKKIKQVIKKHPPKTHWHIDPSGDRIDTFGCLSACYPMHPSEFVRQLNTMEEETSNYKTLFHQKEKENIEKAEEYLRICPYSDLSVFDAILKAIPENQMLQMGNSSVVRYIQLFNQRADLIYFANRGTSGIDGCTSTAIGAALESGKATTFISGDIAFFYDSNALWNKYIPKGFKIILINNGGGGIFRIIPGPSKTGAMEEYFEAQHNLNAEHLAKMYGLRYFSAEDMHSVANGLNALYSDEKPAILEIFTPREENDTILKAYFKCLKQAKKASSTGALPKNTQI